MSLISIRYSGELILVISTMVEVGSGDLDSERFEPFVDFATFFAGKCPH
jgi:hypothetical protein